MSTNNPVTSPINSPLASRPSTSAVKGIIFQLLSHAIVNVVAHSLLVVVRFKATGSAPILKQSFYKITASQKFQTVMNFLRKELNFKPQDPLVRLQVCVEASDYWLTVSFWTVFVRE